MKLRSGFVSNSSSSSFVIGYRGKLNVARLTEALIGNSVIDRKSFLNNVIEDAIDAFLRADEKTLEDFIEEESDPYDTDKYTQESKYFSAVRKIFDSGMTLYMGSMATDSDDAIDQYLVDVDLDIREDDFVLYKEGGF
jgi:hypothetical protein